MELERSGGMTDVGAQCAQALGDLRRLQEESQAVVERAVELQERSRVLHERSRAAIERSKQVLETSHRLLDQHRPLA